MRLFRGSLASKILEGNKEKIKRDSRKNHILIYAKENTTYLEEILYVVEHYNSLPIVLISPDIGIFDGENISQNIDVVSGDFSNRSDCNLVNARDAHCILVIEDPDFNENAFHWRLRNINDELSEYPRIICISDNSNSASNETCTQSTLIDIKKLTTTLTNNLPKVETIQYQLFQELIDFYDQNKELPSIAPSKNRSEDIISKIDSELKSYCVKNGLTDVSISREENTNTFLLQLNDGEVKESLLIHSIDQFLLKTNLDLSDITIFCSVKDFHLSDHNEHFKELNKCNVIIFGIEFAIAISILHEIRLENAIDLWMNGTSSIIPRGETLTKQIFTSPDKIMMKDNQYSLGYFLDNAGETKKFIPFPDKDIKLKVPVGAELCDAIKSNKAN